MMRRVGQARWNPSWATNISAPIRKLGFLARSLFALRAKYELAVSHRVHVWQAVCSTSNDKAVTNLVKTLMGTERLERIQIFAGDIVEKKKPHPDIYNLAKVTSWMPFQE